MKRTAALLAVVGALALTACGSPPSAMEKCMEAAVHWDSDLGSSPIEICGELMKNDPERFLDTFTE